MSTETTAKVGELHMSVRHAYQASDGQWVVRVTTNHHLNPSGIEWLQGLTRGSKGVGQIDEISAVGSDEPTVLLLMKQDVATRKAALAATARLLRRVETSGDTNTIGAMIIRAGEDELLLQEAMAVSAKPSRESDKA